MIYPDKYKYRAQPPRGLRNNREVCLRSFANAVKRYFARLRPFSPKSDSSFAAYRFEAQKDGGRSPRRR